MVMTEITVRFHTDQNQIDPAFFDNLNAVAQQFGLHVEEDVQPAFDPTPRRRKLTHEEFIRKAEEISRRIGPVQSNSADDIRELRNSR